MKLHFVLLILILINNYLPAQSQFKTYVKDHETDEPLAGVNILWLDTNLGTATNEDGYAEINNIPAGSYRIRYSFIGYREEIINVTFPESSGELFEIELEAEAEELEEISVSSTRGSRLITNEPTRVEVIAGEEIDEKITMDPSNISMMLNESTGIQVQQTSAASANNSFRIQGLEGRYTQLLKDGFPLYSGFSGSLSIVQVPPLDLKQIEIIKGSSSTLYGGGAIAGLINLITKEPDPHGELSFLLNGTSAGGIDISGYYSNRFERTGLTFLVSRNTQTAYDNNNDKFSDLPEIERYTITPKFHFYFNKNTLEIGGTFISEDRTGGAIPKIEGNTDTAYNYTEKNKSKRFSLQIKYDYLMNEKSRVTAKNSFGYFKRDLTIPAYRFSGVQFSSFSEISFFTTLNNIEWITGLNLVTEKFNDKSIVIDKRDYSDLTAGFFSQLTTDFSEKYSAEGGIRLDYSKDYDFFFLPRLSLLSKWSSNITTRIGGGLGYKLPTLFMEVSEELAFRNILPINKDIVKAEKSYGVNLDVNYNTILFEVITVSVNNLFFYTRINNPLVLIQSSEFAGKYEFWTFDGYYDTRGLETNLRFTYDHIKLFAGYTYTEVKSHNAVKEPLPLTPKHTLGIVLIYEEHHDFRIGLEAYYTGRQILSNGITTTDYWINGLMIEKHFESISIFLNFENFLDTRQSRFGPMFTGQTSDPKFAEIYAPTDGRIINGGVKVRL